MSVWIYEDGEVKRLNNFCAGKTLARIECDGDDDLTLVFTDGSEAEIGTLGGIAIEELRP